EPPLLLHYPAAHMASCSAVRDQCLCYDRHQTHDVEELIAHGCGTDLAVILYTSGTTGRPKGVMLSFDNILITSRNAVAREGLRDDEEILAYLPMAWVGDHIFSYGQFYCAGFTVNCPESSATVLQDLHEIGPS